MAPLSEQRGGRLLRDAAAGKGGLLSMNEVSSSRGAAARKSGTSWLHKGPWVGTAKVELEAAPLSMQKLVGMGTSPERWSARRLALALAAKDVGTAVDVAEAIAGPVRMAGAEAAREMVAGDLPWFEGRVCQEDVEGSCCQHEASCNAHCPAKCMRALFRWRRAQRSKMRRIQAAAVLQRW